MRAFGFVARKTTKQPNGYLEELLALKYSQLIMDN